MALCIRCGETGLPRKYEWTDGSAKTIVHCDAHYNEADRHIRAEWTRLKEEVAKDQEKAKKEQEQREKAEQQQKINEWKSSHCAKCGSQALIWHYIYDTRTKKLDWSMNNAVNPNQQWVFCSKEHFEEWHDKYYINIYLQEDIYNQVKREYGKLAVILMKP